MPRLRLQVRLLAQHKTKAFTQPKAARMRRDLQSDLTTRVIETAPMGWPDLHQVTEHLSDKFTGKTDGGLPRVKR